MSVEAMSWALNVEGLTTMQRVVLVGIANHYGDGGAWPAVETLARYACCKPRSVQAAIGDLERLGLVVRHLNAGGTRDTRGDRRPNRYELPVFHRHADGVHQGASREADGVHGDAPRGAPGCTLTVQEPSVLTKEHAFTRAEPEPVDNSLSLDDVRRLLREGQLAERVEQRRLEDADGRGRDP